LAGALTRPRIRVPPLASVPDAALATAAIAVLGAWVLLTPIPRMYGLPAQAVWLAVLGGSTLGVTVGARSGRLSVPTLLCVATLAVIAMEGLALFVLPRLHVRPTGPVIAWLATAGLLVLAALAFGRVRRVGARPGELLVVGVVAAFLIGDWVALGSPGIRDLRLYLLAGHHFLDGGQVYATTLMTSIPSDRANLPFLYPPLTLPFFAVLAALPEALVIPAWVAASLGASLLALREFGVRWRWIPVLLLWPPFFEGLWVGNVAVPALLLFALGPRLAAALPLSAVFKLQAAVPVLWLARERRWSSLAIGAGLVVGLVLVTLPFVGLESWRAWVEALRLFQAFEGEVPGLYGAALPRALPYVAFLAVAVAGVAAAMVFGRGPRGLARFGIASVVASPSLYRHGFLVVLPGLLGNGETLFWLALGLGFTPTSIGWWLTTSIGWWLTAAIAAVGTFRSRPPDLRPNGALHPLGSRPGPWS
jgi:hypothetical protein